MARAGLRYTGQEESVECTWCGCILSDWQFGDQVMARHRLASPDCPFVKDESDNVPVLQGDQEEADEAVLEPSGTVSLPSFPSLPPMQLSPQTSRERQSPEGPTALDYHSEADRLASFSNWSVSFISPGDLARAGFFSLDSLDSCKCAFCHNCVGDWVEGDQPMLEHANLFPLCPFVLGREVGNIPLGQDTQSQSNQGLPYRDETGIRWTTSHQERHSAPEQGSQSLPMVGGKSAESIGILRHEGPTHPQHATLEARLRTFREWPPALRQQPKELADAGFYYIGCSDQVKCFYCAGGLRNWQPEDTPWVEHARWFSKCVFVRLVKGDDFIAQCLAERPPEKVGLGEQGSRQVTEEEVRRAMGQAIVRQVLSMGIDASRVKMAIKNQLEASGNPFSSAEQLITAAFGVQREQERRSNRENLNPSGAVLAGLGEHRQVSNSVGLESGPEDIMEVEPVTLGENVSLTPRNNSNNTSVQTTTTTTPTQPTQVLKEEETPNPSAVANGGPPSPAADLESENARLKEQRTCKVCMDGEVGVVFLPCGHLCCCVLCAPSLRDCPVCRTNIQGTVRTFLS